MFKNQVEQNNTFQAFFKYFIFAGERIVEFTGIRLRFLYSDGRHL